ncbi:hypothetical protein FYF90_00065 [Enterobacter sp. RVSM5a]|nr:hypothetical protein FYF90_00065 [Enterobacter sp. RVSM5a]
MVHGTRRDGAARRKALAVDVNAREVHTSARTLGWDALVFATGSTPVVPPIRGGDAPHVFTFRTLAETRAIQNISGPAVVLGGGVLGVEAAAALARNGDNVTLIHRGTWLMEQQLDQQAGLLLDEALAKRGVRCELASGITAIADDAVTLLDGRRIAADARGAGHGRAAQRRAGKSQRHSLRARHRGGSADANLRAGYLRHRRVLRN